MKSFETLTPAHPTNQSLTSQQVKSVQALGRVIDAPAASFHPFSSGPSHDLIKKPRPPEGAGDTGVQSFSISMQELMNKCVTSAFERDYAGQCPEPMSQCPCPACRSGAGSFISECVKPTAISSSYLNPTSALNSSNSNSGSSCFSRSPDPFRVLHLSYPFQQNSSPALQSPSQNNAPFVNEQFHSKLLFRQDFHTPSSLIRNAPASTSSYVTNDRASMGNEHLRDERDSITSTALQNPAEEESKSHLLQMFEVESIEKSDRRQLQECEEECLLHECLSSASPASAKTEIEKRTLRQQVFPAGAGDETRGRSERLGEGAALETWAYDGPQVGSESLVL